MFVIHHPATKQKYGPFGAYANALAYARSRWQDREFYITGSELEGFFTLGIPVDL